MFVIFTESARLSVEFVSGEIFPIGKSKFVQQMEPFVVNVTKETDRKRGFRFFDGCLVSVKDVASEELFLERIKLAYAVFDAVVDPVLDGGLETITDSLIAAVKLCLTKYFNEQSRRRSNRPLIVRTYHRDSDIMFCTSSDFVKTLVYTRERGDALDENEIYFGESRPHAEGAAAAPPSATVDEPAYFARCREEWTRAAASAREHTTFVNDFNPDAPYDGTPDAYGSRPEAILIIIADRTAMTNFVNYMFYMSPTDLRRRYDVSASCLNRSRFAGPKFGAAARACCQERATRDRSGDVVKRAVMGFFQSRAEADAAVREDDRIRRAVDEETGAYAARIRHRNGALLRAFLLLMFDKCLSSVLDNGMENVNKRRRYGTDAKGLGGANIYTGIIDTVGTVNVQYKEGAFVSERPRAKAARAQTTGPTIRFTFPNLAEIDRDETRDG